MFRRRKSGLLKRERAVRLFASARYAVDDAAKQVR
jgi:hypothetical protein